MRKEVILEGGTFFVLSILLSGNGNVVLNLSDFFFTNFYILYFSPFRLIWSVLKVLLPWLLMEKKLQVIYKLESNSQLLPKVIEVQTPKCDIIII